VYDAHVAAICHALGGGGGAGLSGRLDDRSCLHIAGSSGLGGDYQGDEAISGLFDRLASACDRGLRFHRSCVSVTGPGSVRVCGELDGHRGTRSLAATIIAEMAFVGDTIRELRLECADQQSWDVFWG
jgi:hypothetical protein